jgi:hypothetical protein
MKHLIRVTLTVLALASCWVAATGRAGAWQSPAGGSPPLHPARRSPTTADFPTGPAIGERLPDFKLPNQRGEEIDFHADRAGHKAAVLFQRSAVW